MAQYYDGAYWDKYGNEIDGYQDYGEDLRFSFDEVKMHHPNWIEESGLSDMIGNDDWYKGDKFFGFEDLYDEWNIRFGIITFKILSKEFEDSYYEDINEFVTDVAENILLKYKKAYINLKPQLSKLSEEEFEPYEMTLENLQEIVESLYKQDDLYAW